MCEKICCGVLLVSIVCFASEAADPWKDSTLGMRAIVKREFIADDFPTPSVHASTLVEVAPGKLVAAWFGGTNEGTRDVGIWLSRSVDTWSIPIEVANGLTGGTQNPCWNPVLFKTDSKRLLLFYKVGPSPKTWWGVMRESFDEGVSFGDAVNLPERILGPVKINLFNWIQKQSLPAAAAKATHFLRCGKCILNGAPTADKHSAEFKCRLKKILQLLFSRAFSRIETARSRQLEERKAVAFFQHVRSIEDLRGRDWSFWICPIQIRVPMRSLFQTDDTCWFTTTL